MEANTTQPSPSNQRKFEGIIFNYKNYIRDFKKAGNNSNYFRMNTYIKLGNIKIGPLSKCFSKYNYQHTSNNAFLVLCIKYVYIKRRNSVQKSLQ